MRETREREEQHTITQPEFINLFKKKKKCIFGAFLVKQQETFNKNIAERRERRETHEKTCIEYRPIITNYSHFHCIIHRHLKIIYKKKKRNTSNNIKKKKLGNLLGCVYLPLLVAPYYFIDVKYPT